MNIGYVRVSTAEQNEDRQIEAISKAVSHIDKWFTEKVSGKNTEREQFKLMMDFVREGDEVYVLDWSRLSRSTKDLLITIEKLNNKGVKLVSLKESFDTSTPTGKLMLGLISSINQYEREILLERQREGILDFDNQYTFVPAGYQPLDMGITAYSSPVKYDNLFPRLETAKPKPKASKKGSKKKADKPANKHSKDNNKTPQK